MDNRNFLCIGHRGAMGHASENTLCSMRKALDFGVKWVELDVYYVEGELVVIHDDRLERTTNGTGYIQEQSLDYLRSLDAGNGEQIPFLSEILETIDGRAGINIELKGIGTAEPVVKLIKDCITKDKWDLDKFLVSSFNHIELSKAKELFPELNIGALMCAMPVDYAVFAERLNAFSINLSIEFINREFVIDAHSRGLKVFVYTVNHPDDIKKMYDIGVDGVFTNYPDRVFEFVNNLK